MSAQRLRELFNASGKLVKIAGAHNALGATLIEASGLDGVWASGLEISTSYALPDQGILTMAQRLAISASMASAVEVPIVADCDTGFGDVNNVIDMVRKHEAAGIAAVCMQDSRFPINSLVPGRHELAPVDEFVEKITAAKKAQRSADFMVIARVQALIAGCGQDEALRRANAYAASGADAVLIHSREATCDEILEFVDAWDARAPLVLVPTTYHSISEEEILRMEKVKMVIYANQGLRAAISALKKVFRQIVDEGTTHYAEKWIAPLEDVFEIQGAVNTKELEEN